MIEKVANVAGKAGSGYDCYVDGRTGSADRAVVQSLSRVSLGGVDLSMVADQLVALESWDERLSLLQRYPELVHPVIAGRCDAKGVERLGCFLRRAADAGLNKAVEEARILDSLEYLTEDESADGIATLSAAADMVMTGAVWLVPEMVRVGAAIADRSPASSDDLRRLLIPPLAYAAGTSTVDVQRVIALACMEWEDVWSSLERICAWPDLQNAFPAAKQVALLSGDLPDLGSWVSELGGLVTAAMERGQEAAEYEHRLRNIANDFSRGEGIDEFDSPDLVCSQLASEMADLWRRTGAVWLLPEAVAAARRAVQLTDVDSPQRAGRLSNLSGLIGECVQAGLCSAGMLKEALSASRDAVAVGADDKEVQATLSATLGNRISQAIDAGLCSSSVLLEAVSSHTIAWELTAEESPAKAQRASNLGAVIADAIEAGMLPITDLEKALELQDEAIAAVGERREDLPWLLSNRANRIAQAVRFSVRPPEALLDAVQDLRQALDTAIPGHPGAAAIASNLSALLAESVHAGVVSESRTSEAVRFARDALAATPEGHPDWPRYATNLANRLGLGVSAGFEPLTSLEEAVDLAEGAMAATPAGHPSTAARMANLVGRVLAAVRAGVLPGHRIKDIEPLADAMWLAIPSSHPLRGRLAIDVAVLLSESVRHSHLEPSRLRDAVEIAREGLRLLRPDNPDWPEGMSNYSAIVSEAVHEGLLPMSCLGDAVKAAQQALEQVPSGPMHPGLATNASALIAEAVAAGVLPAARVEESLRLQLDALDSSPFPDPDRPAYASNAILRLAEAWSLCLVPRERALQIVHELVDDAWQQSISSVTPTQRHRVAELTSTLARLAPQLLLRLGRNPLDAVVAVEMLEGHLLRGLRAPMLPVGMVAPQLEARYREAASAYDASQLRALDGVGRYADSAAAFREVEVALSDVRRQYPGLLLGDRPSSAELLDAVQEDTLVIYLIQGMETRLARQAGAAVVLGSGLRPRYVDLPMLSHESVAENVAKLLDPIASLPEVCSWLWEAVAEPLFKELGATGEAGDMPCWALVPTGLLRALPLHAASGPSATLDDLVDVVELRSLLAPSGRTKVSHTATTGGLAMALHADDLIFPASDAAVAAAFMPGCRVLPEATTPGDFFAALSGAHDVLLSGHAVHALDVGGSLRLGPPESGLWLTADDLARLPVRKRGTAILAACSSGQPSLASPQEAYGLPTALMGMGFSTVVASLWPVRDSVAFVTVARFLQLRAQDPSLREEEHLRQTRRWLRTATTDDLETWIDGLSRQVELDERPVECLRRFWRNYPDLMHPVPYSDPRDWAAFFCVRTWPQGGSD
mgnify:FL=1